MDNETRFTPVEKVLDVSSETRLWFYLPGYNGYEVSNDGYLRSMKHFKKYPYGMLIQPLKDRNGNVISPNDPIYEMSNNQNQRIQLHISEIIYIGQTNPWGVTGYPRKTYMLDNVIYNYTR